MNLLISQDQIDDVVLHYEIRLTEKDVKIKIKIKSLFYLIFWCNGDVFRKFN
jgi:hypothetical protein